ncbi:hypothetical protein V8C44DRAFT_163279 [Trichoderma aethiopicum]
MGIPGVLAFVALLWPNDLHSKPLPVQKEQEVTTTPEERKRKKRIVRISTSCVVSDLSGNTDTFWIEDEESTLTVNIVLPCPSQQSCVIQGCIKYFCSHEKTGTRNLNHHPMLPVYSGGTCRILRRFFRGGCPRST